MFKNLSLTDSAISLVVTIHPREIMMDVYNECS
jgi:hypothetical protein